MPTATHLVVELEPTVATLLERHLDAAVEWFPHELVPWGRCAVHDPAGPWHPEDTDVPAAVQSSLYVNLLTEDNLPHYFNSIVATFGPDGAWGHWSRRWTAEEGRHSIVLRDYLTVTRAVDPVELERARMAQVEGGQVPAKASAEDGLVYVALQELATRIAHFNTGRVLEDPAGYEVMKRLAGDENLHHLFYRDLCSAAFEIDPSSMVLALQRQVEGFQMPGTGIRDFADHAKRIASAGIYDVAIHHDQIVAPMVRRWRVAELTGLSPEAEQAREELLTYVARLQKIAQRINDRRGRAADVVAAGDAQPATVS